MRKQVGIASIRVTPAAMSVCSATICVRAGLQDKLAGIVLYAVLTMIFTVLTVWTECIYRHVVAESKGGE